MGTIGPPFVHVLGNHTVIMGVEDSSAASWSRFWLCQVVSAESAKPRLALAGCSKTHAAAAMIMQSLHQASRCYVYVHVVLALFYHPDVLHQHSLCIPSTTTQAIP